MPAEKVEKVLDNSKNERIMGLINQRHGDKIMTTENSIKALKDYLFSANVSEWLASAIIDNYGFYFVNYLFNEFNETCEQCGIDNSDNIEYLIFCDGELEESIQFGEHLRNSRTYQFCIEHVMDLFNDYDAIMELVKTENLSVWYDIKNA